MFIIKKIAIGATISAVLAGCVSSQHDGVASTRPAEAMTEGQRIMASTSHNPATDKVKGNNSGVQNVANAGLAGGMASNYGGLGIGMGVLGWLASDTAPQWPSLFASIPAGASPDSYETRYAEGLSRALYGDLTKKGYVRAPAEPGRPTAVTFIKPGCPINARFNVYDRSCSIWVKATLANPRPGDGKTVYGVSLNTTSDGGPGVVDRWAALFPKEMFAYHPATRQQGAYVVKAGKTYPL
ncbi:hypothetical protein D2T29_12770 [Sinirhodobacter populi]|uniref:Lipoprotein n=1 Tax=Paenirhodobacter populi TaxID=2306993 RepID=A0A443KCM1_9RHOB|nr:hypothetical protein [Sinirhodobacter populi]RWR30538.1 hypothetical protein D2T29_12770 [Sinirhodobacter populi]